MRFVPPAYFPMTVSLSLSRPWLLWPSGIDISDDHSKKVTAEDLDWADFVIPVGFDDADYFVEKYPDVKDKVGLLDTDIPDPYFGSVEEYRDVEIL